MAENKLTIDKFIECFKVGYPPKEISAISDLDSVNLYADFFIKNIDDKDFINDVLPRIKDKFASNQIHFFTWIEGQQDSKTFSFWFFPVVIYQNNNLADLIDNAISLIHFRKMIMAFYNKKSVSTIDKKVSVCIVGDYSNEFQELSDGVDIVRMKRQAEIVEQNLKLIEGVEVKLINHQYEKHMNDDTDILIFPNGFMGNAVYRAWISSGVGKRHASMVLHKRTHLPLWLGKSIHDARNPLETDFACAAKGLKDMMKEKCALITTNQVDACIRALSGLIQGSGMQSPILFNLSTGTGTYPDAYPDSVKKMVLNFVCDNKCAFLCFSIVDLFLKRTIDLIQYLKSQTQLPVIVGGIHAELYPEETINIDGVDAICVGEAYTSFVNVLLNWDKRFDAELPDFWFKNAETKEVKKNKVSLFFNGKDYDRVPIPDYSYRNYYLLDGTELKDYSSTPDAGPFKVEQHQIGHEGSVIYSSMGGCSNHCSFCNLTAQVKLREEMLKKDGCTEHVPRSRHKPLRMVERELEELKEYNKNMKFLCVMENDFTCRTEEQVAEYCGHIKSVCNVPFYTMLAPNTISEKKLQSMIENGFTDLNMGIQTNAKFNDKYYDRQISDAKILEVVNMIHKYKERVYPFYDFINFNPEETDESVKETVNLIRQFPLPFDFVIHHLTLGKELLLYKRLVHEKRVLGREVEQTASSDYHNLNMDDYATWKTLYMNIFLEWIAGPHNETCVGRIPRKLNKLKTSSFGKVLFSHEEIKKISVAEDTDIFTLFTETLYPILNDAPQWGLLKRLNSLLPEVKYTNQIEATDNTMCEEV